VTRQTCLQQTWFLWRAHSLQISHYTKNVGDEKNSLTRHLWLLRNKDIEAIVFERAERVTGLELHLKQLVRYESTDSRLELLNNENILKSSIKHKCSQNLWSTWSFAFVISIDESERNFHMFRYLPEFVRFRKFTSDSNPIRFKLNTYKYPPLIDNLLL